jgi:hypothetical protein
MLGPALCWEQPGDLLPNLHHANVPFRPDCAQYPRRAVPDRMNHDAGHGSYGTAGAQAESIRKNHFWVFACIALWGDLALFGDIMMVVTGVVTLYLYSIGSVLVSSAIFLWHPTLDPGQLRDAPPFQCEHMGAKHPRFHLHVTPASASWLSLVERSRASESRVASVRTCRSWSKRSTSSFDSVAKITSRSCGPK